MNFPIQHPKIGTGYQKMVEDALLVRALLSSNAEPSGLDRKEDIEQLIRFWTDYKLPA